MVNPQSQQPAQYIIGLMSGTSLDGVDGVLVEFFAKKTRIVSVISSSFTPQLVAELLALNTSGADELQRGARAANALAQVYAQVVHGLLADSGLASSQISAIGVHGQTVRHQPQWTATAAGDQAGYTIQLNNPALLAELTDIDVVADFRSRDVAARGQGAPLAPFFHQAWFAQAGRTVGVLNIGGISNLTVLAGSSISTGFDCGPGNALMDGWCKQHTGAAYDDDGAWAAGGAVHAALLIALQNEAYFALPAPKSTGRDLFNAAWLNAKLAPFSDLNPRDVQATLTELTAWACAQSLCAYPDSSELIVCGGGALNGYLMRRISALVQPSMPAQISTDTPAPPAAQRTAVQVISSAQRGLPALQVEATAFAWLARKMLRREALHLHTVTGAGGARVLGALYPA
jgi:anhydro-N-acetylmuramic acid kinase